MKNIITLLLLGSMLLLPYGCKKSENVNINVEAEILKEMEAKQIPSVVACIVKDDKIVWETTLGYANVNHSIQATNQSIYFDVYFQVVPFCYGHAVVGKRDDRFGRRYQPIPAFRSEESQFS